MDVVEKICHTGHGVLVTSHHIMFFLARYMDGPGYFTTLIYFMGFYYYFSFDSLKLSYP